MSQRVIRSRASDMLKLIRSRTEPDYHFATVEVAPGKWYGFLTGKEFSEAAPQVFGPCNKPGCPLAKAVTTLAEGVAVDAPAAIHHTTLTEAEVTSRKVLVQEALDQQRFVVTTRAENPRDLLP